MTSRRSGVLLHVTSLPGPFGVGDLGDEAFAFLRWCSAAGQSLWQVLPLNPTGMGHSPYAALSSFAGNPLLISPRQLQRDGLIDEKELRITPGGHDEKVAFESVRHWKEGILRIAWNRMRSQQGSPLHRRFERFVEEESSWLSDWTLFAALKHLYGGRPWHAWDGRLARRDPSALASARRDHQAEIAWHAFVQFLFFRQWELVRQAARELGIAIIGDVPIYVAGDSADVWANQEIFQLGDDLLPTAVAGVPPDYFSETGQRWGNPLYRWEEMAKDDYSWWVRRLEASLRFSDIVRLDHFRGFAAWWEIPAAEETAVNGAWREGPGLPFFEVIGRRIGGLPFIAEDLGLITPDVIELRDAAGLPGMSVLQFAFGEADSEYLPHNHVRHSVVYTGTHDNDTTAGWLRAAGHDEKRRALDYLGGGEDGLVWQMIRAAYGSVAETAIVPMQDLLQLGSEARMNVPGAVEDNWSWRARYEHFNDGLAQWLQRLATLSGRTAA